MRVLLTCVGGDLSPELIKCFKAVDKDIFVLGVDMSAEAAGQYFSDAFCCVPSGTSPDYVERIRSLVADYKIDFVLPGSDEEALALARSRAIVEAEGAILGCAPLQSLEIMADKGAFYSFLEQHKLPTPVFGVAFDEISLRHSLMRLLDLGRDAVVKPALSRGGRDVLVIHATRELVRSHHDGREVHLGYDVFWNEYAKAALGRAPLVVMERLFEPVYDVDILANEGSAIHVVPRRRINPAGIPARGNIIEKRLDLIDTGHALARALNLSWLYDVDVMSDVEGRPVAIEMNPRPSGSLVASVVAGIPLVADLLALARGQRKFTPVNIPDRKTVVTYLTAACVDDVSKKVR